MPSSSCAVPCPHCRSLDNEWVIDETNRSADGGLGCRACARYLPPPQREPRHAYDVLAEAGAYDRYPPTYALERAERRSVEYFEQLERRRARPLAIKDVERVFAGVAEESDSPIVRELLSVLALWEWGATPKLDRSLSARRDPKRPAFGSLASALACATEVLDGQLGTSRGTTYNVAEAKGTLRHGLRGGIVHCKPSKSGASPTVRGQERIELQVDAQRAIARACVGEEDLVLLRIAAGTKRGGYARAAEAWLRKRGELAGDATPSTVQEAVKKVLPAISGRLKRAGRRLEKSLRAIAPNPPEGWNDDVPLLRLREGDEPEEPAEEPTTDTTQVEGDPVGVELLQPTPALGLCA